MWKQIKRKNKQDTWPEDGNTCKVQQEETTQKYKHYIYCVSDEMSMLFQKKDSTAFQNTT